MELTQLQYFRTVARMQHITQASKVLHISQPALSRAISRLEEELGVVLFERSGNRISLSSCGVSFLNRVDQAFRELENGVEEIHTMQDDEYGTVNFAAFTAGLVSEPMRNLLLQYPNIRLNHIVVPHETIKTGLENGSIDIALTLFPVESTLVQWTPIAHDELIVLVNEENPLSQTRKLNLEDLKTQKIAIVSSSFGTREVLEGFCSNAGFSPVLSYVGSDSELAMSLLRQNSCIFVIHASVHVWKVEEDRRQKSKGENSRPFRFRAMRIQNPTCPFNYGICVPKDKLMSKATFTFYTMLREYLTHWNLRCEQEGMDQLVDL